MKQRQELMFDHLLLGEIRAHVDATEQAAVCSPDLAKRLRQASGLLSAAAIAVNSALRLTLPDETAAEMQS